MMGNINDKSKLKSINVFQGCGKSVEPKTDLFLKWNMLKGKAGNTSPAASLPFGNVSCSPYSGGYSSGYGSYKVNCGEPLENFFEGNKIYGFSHFNHSGVGGIGIYYNYFLVSPFIKDFKENFNLKEFDQEIGYPGYYSCRLIKENVKCEVTVGDKIAVHRYTALDDNTINLSIDVTNNGLRQDDDRIYSKATDAKVHLYKNGHIGGYFVNEGVKFFYYIETSDKAIANRCFIDNDVIDKDECFFKEGIRTMGCLLQSKKSQIELKVGFSFVSEEFAKQVVLAETTFNERKTQALEIWNKYVKCIDIYGVSDEDKEIFYSNLYHTLLKPCLWKKGSFLWKEEEDFFVDFSTLWDIYKTQIPMIFLFYRDIGKGIIKTLLRYGKENKVLLNALLMSLDRDIESQQACCLGCYVLYDGYTYGLVDEKDVDDMFLVVKNEINQYSKDIFDGKMEKTTKLLDACYISYCFAELAKKLGRLEEERAFMQIYEHWIEAFGENGLLKSNYPYYEGNEWNYSFRFVHDPEKRIELAGGKEKLVKQLDAFFGFNDETCIDNRFEGFNNETDMETPYFYHYVGCYDKICEIMYTCTNECFRTGRDGLPGNNDSGGLSSCYIWNFLGLFPISGQASFFLGIPHSKKSVLHLGNGKELTIVSEGEGKKVKEVKFNGKTITTYKISLKEIQNGGLLIFIKE